MTPEALLHRLREVCAHPRHYPAQVWKMSEGNARGARMVVLKLKTKEFNSLTRSLTPPPPPSSYEEFETVTLRLRERVKLGSQQLYRLVGVSLCNF